MGKFGLRNSPRFTPADVEIHLKLEEALRDAVDLLDDRCDMSSMSPIPTYPTNRAHMLVYAMGLQRAVIELLKAIDEYCEASIRTTGCQTVTMVRIEGVEYRCTYLNDHMCRLLWIVGKICLHVRERTGA